MQKREILLILQASVSNVFILHTQKGLRWFLCAISEEGCQGKDQRCGRSSDVTAFFVLFMLINSSSLSECFYRNCKGLNFSSGLTKRETEHMQEVGI